ncbi:hypothetical protein SAMN02745129_2444 [Ferrimonas marina]|uniref:Homeodomain-like domain-containing protein n=1 Tax=Ferrimonas marina TaxID=299255 RepID=A0A1M5U7V1_9GAMM|nr:hypothetical protein SAMN02745129_2444 [Ferrimonas marina]
MLVDFTMQLAGETPASLQKRLPKGCRPLGSVDRISQRMARFVCLGLVQEKPQEEAVDVSLRQVVREQLDCKVVDLASRLGVPRKTLYRWWAEHPEMILAALAGVRVVNGLIERGAMHNRAWH